jgi:hypothetical protein
MDFDKGLKILAILGAIASFLWGVYQWREKSAQDIEVRKLESSRLVETRRIEATKPFLDRQLALYTEVSRIASQIVTQGDTEVGKKALLRFEELYWGELALVESPTVEAAMVRMMNGLRNRSTTSDELKQSSLALVHACRESLDKSWGIHAWASPDKASTSSR